MSERVLTLYGRSGCHLCDEMAAALESRLAGRGIRLDEVDVDTDPELKSRFGWSVPLLFENGAEIFRHEFNAVAFETWLSEGR